MLYTDDFIIYVKGKYISAMVKIIQKEIRENDLKIFLAGKSNVLYFQINFLLYPA